MADIQFAQSNLTQEAYQGELASLRANSARLAHLVDILPAGVVILDEKGLIAEANQIAIDFLGEPLTGERWINVIDRAFDPQADDGHEVSLKDGRRVKIQTTDLSPEPGQLVLLTDMTETRILQGNVAKHKHLSALGHMMATLAHQIRTPLSAAMLYGANLANCSLSLASKASFQQKLMSRLHDLEKQINDMLLFAKGDQQHVAQQISLQQLLSEVQAGSEAMIIESDGLLDTQLPEPDVLIYGNKNALASAIQNLIHNSIQVIGSGAKIKVAAIRKSDDANMVSIEVADNGPGIAEKDLSHVFEPFYTTRSKGTGLGLAVVKSVAEQHNGCVSVTSELGKGTTFKIALPIAAIAEQVMPTAVGQN